MPRRRLATVALAAIALLLFVVAPAGAAPAGADKSVIRFAGIQQHGRTLGNSKAPVTISFFHEIKCPFCRDFDQNVLPKIIKRYVRTGRVKIVAYPQVFDWADNGADSRRATRFAVAMAKQNLYWNVIDLFYANQLGESETYATDEFVSGLAAAIPGANSQLAFDARDTRAVRNELRESEKLMKAFGIYGVPTLYVSKTGVKPPVPFLGNVKFAEVQDHSSIKSFDALIRRVERSLRPKS